MWKFLKGEGGYGYSRGYILISEGNAHFFSKYPLFDGTRDAYFKGYT